MASSLLSVQLHPGRALGFFVLGASLHETLTRLKAEPQRFPKLDLLYSPTDPITQPVILNLPSNGIRLRFDGPEQRLRLVEVIDFGKNHVFLKPANDKERDLVRPPAVTDPLTTGTGAGTSVGQVAGPSFRHIYNRFLGPTYDGEYIPHAEDEDGTYVLSYPGVAFTFPMPSNVYDPNKDVVSLLSSSSSATHTATSMALFAGDSWAQARETMWTAVLPSPKISAPWAKSSRDRDTIPDEVSLIRIHGGGVLQLVRRWSEGYKESFWLVLGETRPQDLVAELGPPDAIYRKNDQRMYIHKLRTASHSRARRPSELDDGLGRRRPDDLNDTDVSSAHTTASDASDDEDVAVEDEVAGNVEGECFYNYFYLGFDILVSTPTPASQPPPSQTSPNPALPNGLGQSRTASSDRLVATKLILHGNVPGSYPFNRHRRCRWEIVYLPSDPQAPINSETAFSQIESALRDEWRPIYASDAEARSQQRGMVLNRGWGDSPGSSCELLGGWEEGRRAGGTGSKKGGSSGEGGGSGVEDSTTTLFGFPGLVFEVLKNGFVSALTVF